MNNDYLHYGTTIALIREDQQIIEDMSDSICRQDRSHFVNNYKIDKSIKLYDMNINGFGAELAFCRLCDVEFDSSTIQSENHFNNADATLKDGRTVDVKNTIYPFGKLLVRKGKEKKLVDIYALMIGKFPKFKFSGWSNYKDIIKAETLLSFKHGYSYCLPQNKLNRILTINNNE